MIFKNIRYCCVAHYCTQSLSDHSGGRRAHAPEREFNARLEAFARAALDRQALLAGGRLGHAANQIVPAQRARGVGALDAHAARGLGDGGRRVGEHALRAGRVGRRGRGMERWQRIRKRGKIRVAEIFLFHIVTKNTQETKSSLLKQISCLVRQ